MFLTYDSALYNTKIKFIYVSCHTILKVNTSNILNMYVKDWKLKSNAKSKTIMDFLIVVAFASSNFEIFGRTSIFREMAGARRKKPCKELCVACCRRCIEKKEFFLTRCVVVTFWTVASPKEEAVENTTEYRLEN